MPAKDQIELCLVTRHVWPVLAGAAERFRRYAPGLRSRGVRMSAFARLPDETMPLHETAPGGVDIYRVPGNQCSVEHWDRLLFQMVLQHQTASLVRARILQTNVSYAHTRALIQRVRGLGMPAVWTGSMMEDITPGMNLWRSLRERLRLRYMFAAFDACAVGSTIMRDWLRSSWVPNERIRVIGHGVDFQRFYPVSSPEQKLDLRRKLGLPEKGVIVLMVGTITSRKGAHLLLEAWEKELVKLPQAHLVLAGGFDRPTVVHGGAQRELVNYQEGIHRQLAALQPSGRVRHVGEISAIADWMRASDILVLPSEREGVPNVVLEAMSCGLPCLLTPFAGLPREELGEEGQYWHLCQRNVASIAGALTALIENEPLRIKMGCAAAERASSQFGLERTLDDYASLYHELVSR